MQSCFSLIKPVLWAQHLRALSIWSTLGCYFTWWPCVLKWFSGHHSPNLLATCSHMRSVDLIHKFRLIPPLLLSTSKAKASLFAPLSSDPKLDFNNWGVVPFKVLNGPCAALLFPPQHCFVAISNAKVPLLSLHLMIFAFFLLPAGS